MPVVTPGEKAIPSFPLKVYNTLSRQLEDFEPCEPGKVKLYVCGPTVYDDAHLGHARCYITWDVLYRWLSAHGYEVQYVRNITDIDDKILDRAKKGGISPQDVADKNYASFHQDMRALNVLDPVVEPFATHYIRQMLEGVQELIRKGAAYVTSEGSVYYRTAYKKDYGKLSQKPLDDLIAGARVEPDPNKESPMDFALWKHVSADDPYFYESPWGHGRPGWHMECSTMIHAILGDRIDIHAGGADLIFPHHENEIAQSEAWTEKTPFVKYWMHNGFVNVSGEKMSKSLGNFSTIKKVLGQYDANTIRYFLLTHHYRMPVDFNDEALESARNWTAAKFGAIREICLLLRLEPADMLASISSGRTLTSEIEKNVFLAEFSQAMSQDLNTPQALAVLNKALSHLNRTVRNDAQETGDQAGTRAVLMAVFHMLSVFGFDLSVLSDKQPLPLASLLMLLKNIKDENFVSEEVPSKDAEKVLDAIVDIRRRAKAEKNWSKADIIRNELVSLGIQIKDNKDGQVTWERIP